MSWTLCCVDCRRKYPGLTIRTRCDCGGTLDVMHDLKALGGITRDLFDRRLASRSPIDRSGVWRFRELVLPIDADAIVTKPEGNTNHYRSPRVSAFAGVELLLLKHEGENPTGSFKDRGMTVGVSVARKLGMDKVACASTGNTAASLAAYAAMAGLRAFVFVPAGGVAYGKLSQAIAYGARTLQLEGDFDRAMQLVEELCRHQGVYLLNSVNPFRIEGQKAIAFELLQDLGWQVPDWIVVPGGNLGNNSALSKGLQELLELGLIRRMPRLAVIQAEGANPLYTAFRTGQDLVPVASPRTIASAIRIGNPISWRKSLRGLEATGGLVEQVSDQEILDAKAQVDAAGIGAEPASCAAVAGVRKLSQAGIIRVDERVAVILTGHMLKDPDAILGYHQGTLEGIRPTYPNPPIRVAADPEAVIREIS